MAQGLPEARTSDEIESMGTQISVAITNMRHSAGRYLDAVIALRRPNNYSPEQSARFQFILKSYATEWMVTGLCHLRLW